MTQRAVSFTRFGGLRLDLPVDEAGDENAIFLRDVDWDGSIGKLRSRDGFQKLKASEATGTYKALFPHSATRLLATKRVSAESVKIVAVDREGAEKTEATWPKEAAKATFARFGTPSASYTYGRAALSTAKPVRFDGSAFSEPTATVGGAAGKEMPRGNLMATWSSENRLATANTGSEGGPNKLASSSSHVWFSEPGNAEGYETSAYVQLSPGDGEEIVAMCTWGSYLFVFKETKFFWFWGVSSDGEGNPVFNYRETTLGEGSRMKRATGEALAESSDQLAVATPDGVCFATSAGIFLTTGGDVTKLSEALRPLEEVSPFDGPMADFLNGSTETCRWPAAGLFSLGRRLIVKRYEYLFVYDFPAQEWTCWKMPAISMAVWTGLSGGGAEGSVKGPGTVVDNSGTGSVAWSSPSNAKTINEVSAAAGFETAGEQTHYLLATNFGFAIPSGATIKGILATVIRSSSGARDARVRIVKGGAIKATEDKAKTAVNWPEYLVKEEPYTGAVLAETYGGPEDLWGNSWLYSDINSTEFGIAISAQSTGSGVSARVDAVTLTVYYTTSEASGVRPRLLATSGKSIYWTGPSAEEQAGTRNPEWQSGFYDLDDADEKTLVAARLWGAGDVDLAVGEDFGAPGDPTEFKLGASPAIDSAQANKSQTAALFSHKFSGSAPWSVQRFTRWLREETAETSKRR